ncbi:hypothetical protein Q9L58_001993 [Maublancomyces gigas]|uniref:NADH dehydrogenase [ubiquinone] 1 beta subcomplex subunit 4 n=1 Tax=Discina gigas TaxID=1032678 RepID=A0ABR3GSP8_9PEZI
MAGHSKILHQDPALIKYAALNSERFRFFRWTNRTAKLSFIYVVAIPFALGVLAYKTDAKYQFRGKRRGDIISEF